VKDLLDVAITIIKDKDMQEFGPLIKEQTEQRLLQMLMGEQNDDENFRQDVLELLRAGALEVSRKEFFF
jgi:ATP-dependent protease HslVU (ClpYQ) ATPase subunit